MTPLRHFEFEVRGPDGLRRRGALTATDLATARDQLVAEGATPLKLVERSPRSSGGDRQRHASARAAPLSERAAGDFAADLARLLAAGMPLVASLRACGDIAPRRREFCNGIARQIEGGLSLSAALRVAEGSSHSFLAALAQVGERSGLLGDVMRDAAETLREAAAFRARLLSLLLYPAVVALLTVVILLVFLLVVAPTLRPLFDGVSLPYAARILFAVSDATRLLGPFALVGALLASGLLSSTPAGRSLLRDVGEALALSPFAMGAPAMAAFSTYARAIGLALRRGVPLPEAHNLAAGAVWARRLRRGLLRHAGDLEAGAQLSGILGRTPLAPVALLQLTAAGEAAGRLAPALTEAGAMLADDARLRAERLVALAGPAITVALGGLVGMVVLTLFRTLASIAEVAS